MTPAAPALLVPTVPAPARPAATSGGDDPPDAGTPSRSQIRSRSAPRHRIVDVVHIWDTVVSVELHLVPAGVDVPGALAAVRAFLEHVDATFSVFRPDSLVSALRRGEPDEERLLWHPRTHAERDLAEVISCCRRARVLTRGAFDPWAVPGGFDPSGLVKGWAAGRAVQLLNRRGVRHAMVNAGGDITVTGGAAPHTPWRIGIRDPLDPHRLIAVVELVDGSIATSGRYERGDHLHRPACLPAGQECPAATAVGPGPALTDALATALTAGGRPAAAAVTQLPGYTFLVTDPHNRHHRLLPGA